MLNKNQIKTSLILILLIVIALMPTRLQAQKFQKYFVDSTDNALDVSGFLNAPIGFLPIPMLITEPALGYGGGLGLVYFHKNKKERSGNFPPIMSMAAAATTANGTWVGVLAHQGSYAQDRFRYTGVVGRMSVNLKYYNEELFGDKEGNAFNVNGFFTFHEFLTRVKRDLPIFLGANYVYFNSKVKFDTGIDFPGLESFEIGNNLGGLNFVTFWDNRDNTFTPTKGIMAAFEVGKFSKVLGGDNDYSNFGNRVYAYVPIIKDRLFSGYRLNLESKWTEGDEVVPFYELPSIRLRGIPMSRYQNHHVSVVETEWRFQVKRWSLVGFAGVGFASEKLDLKLEDGKAAYGGGFRYFLAKQYGIHGGIDIAKGPEDWAWYLTVGSNWFR